MLSYQFDNVVSFDQQICTPGGDDAIVQAEPTGRAISGPTAAGGSGTTFSTDLEGGGWKPGAGQAAPLYLEGPEAVPGLWWTTLRLPTRDEDARSLSHGAQGIGPLGSEGGPGPAVGKPNLSQAFYIRTFAKGVEKDIKKMATKPGSPRSLRMRCPGTKCSTMW
jgi:hypothetical protein